LTTSEIIQPKIQKKNPDEQKIELKIEQVFSSSFLFWTIAGNSQCLHSPAAAAGCHLFMHPVVAAHKKTKNKKQK